MKKRTNKLVALLLSGALLLTVAGCGSGNATASAKTGDGESTEISEDAAQSEAVDISEEDTLTIAITDEINNIDIIHAYAFWVDAVLNGISEGLFYYDKDSQIQPNLVESFDQPDETTYVYHIKDGVYFSTGDPLTADDVVFSLERQRNPENGGELSWMFENVVSIEKTGDLEVTVKLAEPDVTWHESLATTASLVVSEKYFNEHSENFGTAEGGIVGSGPYVLDSWEPGQEIVLVENQNYWNKENKQVDFKKVVLKYIADTSVSKLAIQQGEVDYVASLTPDDAEELAKTEGISLHTIYPFSEQYLSFNCSKAPFDDVNFRKAISYAVDRKAIVESLFYGKYAEVGTGLAYGPETVTVGREYWTEWFENLETYERDVDKAKEYLEKSSSEPGVSVTLKYPAAKTTDESVALIVQQNLAEIGINVELVGISGSEHSTLRYGGSETRDYDILLTGWGSDYPDPVGVILPMFVSTNDIPGGSNWFEFKSEKFDELIYESNHEFDIEKRAKLLQEASGILADEQPGAALYYPYHTFALSDKVEYEFSPMFLYNQYLADFKKAK